MKSHCAFAITFFPVKPAMPSEHRLHPYSIVFAFLAQIKTFVVPGVLLLVGAGSRGGDWWQPWMMLFIIPNAIVAIIRYVSYRYRYEPQEIVIRSGLVFRKERHIPYARIQNIDAVQRVLHRLLDVVEVRVETGGGQTAEATMSVLPMSAFLEMRERVFAERHSTISEEPPLATPVNELLRLSTRDLLLSGFIENRGAVVIAAGFGVVFELGLIDRVMERTFGDEVSGRRLVRDLFRDSTRNLEAALSRIVTATAALIGLLLFVRLLSMVWAAVRLHGFRLTLEDDDLRSEYGLFTHVAATIPLRRIQTLSIYEGPWHRLFRRVAVRANTAGGRPNAGGGSEREWLAPILHKEALPRFAQQVLLGATDLTAIEWQAVSPRAFRREVKGWLFLAGAFWAGAFWLVGWWSLLIAPLLVAWAVIGARQTVKHLGWAANDEAVFFRAGWLWKRVIAVRFGKIQTVTLATSPFDRRALMARVRVDTAGASEATRINIPYLPHEIAQALYTKLAAEAAKVQFKW